MHLRLAAAAALLLTLAACSEPAAEDRPAPVPTPGSAVTPSAAATQGPAVKPGAAAQPAPAAKPTPGVKAGAAAKPHSWRPIAATTRADYLRALATIDRALAADADRAVSRGENTCSDLEQDKDAAQLTASVTARFTGGTTTVDQLQAAQIIATVKATICPNLHPA